MAPCSSGWRRRASSCCPASVSDLRGTAAVNALSDRHLDRRGLAASCRIRPHDPGEHPSPPHGHRALPAGGVERVRRRRAQGQARRHGSRRRCAMRSACSKGSRRRSWHPALRAAADASRRRRSDGAHSRCSAPPAIEEIADQAAMMLRDPDIGVRTEALLYLSPGSGHRSAPRRSRSWANSRILDPRRHGRVPRAAGAGAEPRGGRALMLEAMADIDGADGGTRPHRGRAAARRWYPKTVRRPARHGSSRTRTRRWRVRRSARRAPSRAKSSLPSLHRRPRPSGACRRCRRRARPAR